MHASVTSTTSHAGQELSPLATGLLSDHHLSRAMIALADNRSATPHLQASHVLLSGSGRIGRSAFDVVTRNLISLGALALEELATSPKADIEGFDIPYTSSYPETSSGSSSQFQTAEGSGSTGDVKLVSANPTLPSDEKDKSFPTSSSMQFVAQLHKACQQAFGNHESLKFEFIEEGGPDCKYSPCRPFNLFLFLERQRRCPALRLYL